MGLVFKGLNDDSVFHTTKIDNFGPLNIFSTKNHNSALFKVWVTLYTCAETRGILLGLVYHTLIQNHSLEVLALLVEEIAHHT